MAATSGRATPRRRRRRSDAEQNRSAILQAATEALNAQPGASMEDIAAAAGVSRQTIYAHFPSRELLLNSVVARATEEVSAVFAEAGLADLPPAEALARLLERGWAVAARYPFLWHLPPVSAADDRDRHGPVVERLQEIIRSGQERGDFDDSQPADWLLAAGLALGRAAEEQVKAGRMTVEQATAAVHSGFLRLLGQG